MVCLFNLHNLHLTMKGGSNDFLGVENLHPLYFFGSRDLSCFFFKVFKSVWLNKSVLRY